MPLVNVPKTFTTSPSVLTKKAIVMQPTGKVYFVEAVGLSLIKIGFTENLTRRFIGLMTSSPARLSLLASMDGTPQTERDLHLEFAEHCSHGEWFHKTPAVLAAVARAEAPASAEWMNRAAGVQGAGLQAYLAKMKAGEVVRPTRGPSRKRSPLHPAS